MESEYHIGDIVWVKIKGYPWWPGIVSNMQYIISITLYIQIKSIILNNNNTTNKNKQKSAELLSSSENQAQKYIIKFFIELTESTISDITKIKPFLKYKKELGKIKQKKLMNAIKFANIISMGQMSFDQHYHFIKEGIITFEEQMKKLGKIKKMEKKAKKIINDDNYDIIVGDMNHYDNIDITFKCNDRNNDNNNENMINNKKDIISDDNTNINKDNKNKDNVSFVNSAKKYKFKVEKINDDSKDRNNNINNNMDDRNEKRRPGRKRRFLGKKRKNISNTVKHRLIMDLIYSIDDFIYNKRDFKLNGYDSFFEEIQSKISKNNILNTNGLNVSKT